MGKWNCETLTCIERCSEFIGSRINLICDGKNEGHYGACVVRYLDS